MKKFCGAIFDMSDAGKDQGFADFINGCLGCFDVATNPKGAFFCPDSSGQPVPGAAVVSFSGDGSKAICECVEDDPAADPTLPLVLGSVVFVGGALIYFRDRPRVKAFIEGVSGACNAVHLRLTAPAKGSEALIAPVGSDGFSDPEAGGKAGGKAGASAEASTGTGQSPATNPMGSYQQS